MGWCHLEDRLVLALAEIMVKTVEKAAVLDADDVCRIQAPWSVSDRIWEEWCVLRQLPAGMDGWCRRGRSHGAEGCGGTGEVFSLQWCLFPQQSKPVELNPGGFRPQYMPIFLSTCMYMFMFLLLALLESAEPFHEGLTYTKEQARKQTGSKRRPN